MSFRRLNPLTIVFNYNCVFIGVVCWFVLRQEQKNLTLNGAARNAGMACSNKNEILTPVQFST